MAASDIIKVQRVYTDPVNGTSLGLEEPIPLGTLLAAANATTSTAGLVKQAAHIAPVAVPFADLSAAATAYNALLAAMVAAGQMA